MLLVYRIIPAGILEWVPFPFPGDLPDPRIKPVSLASPALAGGFLTTEPSGKPHTMEMHHPILVAGKASPRSALNQRPPPPRAYISQGEEQSQEDRPERLDIHVD